MEMARSTWTQSLKWALLVATLILARYSVAEANWVWQGNHGLTIGTDSLDGKFVAGANPWTAANATCNPCPTCAPNPPQTNVSFTAVWKDAQGTVLETTYSRPQIMHFCSCPSGIFMIMATTGNGANAASVVVSATITCGCCTGPGGTYYWNYELEDAFWETVPVVTTGTPN